MKISQSIRGELERDLQSMSESSRRVDAVDAVTYEREGQAFAYLTEPSSGLARLGLLLGENTAQITENEFDSVQLPPQLGGRWVEFIITGELGLDELRDFIVAAYNYRAS